MHHKIARKARGYNLEEGLKDRFTRKRFLDINPRNQAEASSRSLHLIGTESNYQSDKNLVKSFSVNLSSMELKLSNNPIFLKNYCSFKLMQTVDIHVNSKDVTLYYG